ncbi:MAG: nuclear transport factor 2 family protein [Nakamurella sp.]
MNDDSSELMAKAEQYLKLCEERQLDEAATYLAPGVQLVFPGTARYGNVADMVAASTGRYRSIRKERIDYTVGTRKSDGSSVVVSTGTLNGTACDGSTFDGIRYVDVFVFRDGLIAEQHVFNDLAESGVLNGAGDLSRRNQ